ncbi:acyltransferase family protein [Candidatus Omnitrophota bacterium]
MKNGAANYWMSEVQLLRGFAIGAALLIHVIWDFSISTKVSVTTLMNIFLDSYMGFAVPLFVLLSGFVLYYKYNTHFSRALFYKRRALSILPQYIAFSLFYIMFAIIMGGNISIKGALLRIATGKSSPHLWFFILIIQIYILYPYIANVYLFCKKRKALALLITVAFLIQALSWMLLIILKSDYNSYDAAGVLRRTPFLYIGYFIFGMHLSQNYSNLTAMLKSVKTSLLFVASICICLVISAFIAVGFISYGGYASIPSKYFIPSAFFFTSSAYYPICDLVKGIDPFIT